MKNNEWKKICAACSEGTPPERCAYYGDPNGCNAPTLGKHPEGDLAERLQDELEKAERRISELERATENSAALRVALESIIRNLAIHIQCGRFVAPGDHVSFAIAEADAYIRDARAALAAPRRNCDVGTKEEQKERLNAFCEERDCHECPFSGNSDCPLEWALAPFAPAEGGGHA